MLTKTILGALALTFSTAAIAAEPAPPAPKKECCCCKKGEDAKMACCDKGDKAGHEGEDHKGHDMGNMKIN